MTYDGQSDVLALTSSQLSLITSCVSIGPR